MAGGLCALAVCTRSFHKSSTVKPKTDFALRSPATPALDTKARRAGMRPPSCAPSATGSKRPKFSGFAAQPQLCRCPTPFPSPKRRPATIPPADLGSKSSPEPEINAHPLRRNAAENTKPPERTITVRPCGGETRDVRTKRLFISAFLEACPPRTNGQTIMIAKSASSFSQASSGRDNPNQV